MGIHASPPLMSFLSLLVAVALVVVVLVVVVLQALRRAASSARTPEGAAAPTVPPASGAGSPLPSGDPQRIGPYRLRTRLGSGGMGRVYLGTSPGGRDVAIKVVHPELAGDPEFRRRFAAEVEAARRVGGFHTAQVVDAEPDGDPPWLATAYVPGPTLYAAVRDHGPLPADSVAALGAGLAEGLVAVHACRIVHRDLKPGNVLLAADGPRLIDFGIARALDATSHTRTHAVLGTAAFMSPEQVTGDAVGPASDVFSLGCVLAFAATGRSPFGEGPAHALTHRIVYSDPDLSGLTTSLKDLVSACLAKDPAARPTPDSVLAACDTRSPAGPGRPAGAWPPEALTEVITAHETRVLPPVASSPSPSTVPGQTAGRKGALAALAVAASAVLLYAGHEPLSVAVSHALEGGSAELEVRDCATDFGGSVAEVPCWTPAAEYRVPQTTSWGTEGTPPDDPGESCEEDVEDWVEVVEYRYHYACLVRLP
ncbi:serine/threonine-protein kinase [Nocardiopsis tropica]|uniref:Serine/threonine-protein kinase n=1 Tax=Nocardiopsis tropica TaxID=109330 RepID=A0ABU7L2A7_9ACTN|nr:serine/threonine-protein kinase [Nocardiopsis umidischolae]MEE2055379.1 serine/threonine-protein kinase [Nocardiopsis umidischolae]